MNERMIDSLHVILAFKLMLEMKKHLGNDCPECSQKNILL